MDPCYTSTVIPRLIRDLGAIGKDISCNNCITQLFTAHSLAAVMFFLVSMAFDHYVTIVRPLHYMVIVSWHRCDMLITVAWGIVWPSVALLLVVQVTLLWS